jgi:lipoprotein-anchoring transpeptidase ErfK/SrfK
LRRFLGLSLSRDLTGEERKTAAKHFFRTPARATSRAPWRGDFVMTRICSLRCAASIAGRRLALQLAVAGLTLAVAATIERANAQSFGYAPLAAASNLPPVDATNEQDAVPAHLRKTMVAYDTREAPGTIVIDTANTYLYYVLGHGRAIRYGVGVGREGFTWSGVQSISRKAEWPDWIPPPEMIARQPYLPRWIGGGPGNPLGARAMYLGTSVYRIHGTNDPTTIGKFVSSGCIRMTNEDVVDLFNRVDTGTRVVVLPKVEKRMLDAYAAMPARETTVTINRQLPPRNRVVSGVH